MRRFFLASITLVASISYVGVYHATDATPASREQAVPTNTPTTSDANRLLQGQPGFFVPNLGQWDHAARFVHRSGPMTLFLETRGWVIDIVERPVEPKTKPYAMHRAMPDDREVDQKIQGVALRMTFEGDDHVPNIVGEQKRSGHHNYFLGNDENRWRTNVPLYSSVRYEGLYPGIDLRLREMNGVPEYDLLLQAGADLSLVNVHVEGAKALSIARDGSLVIETALGPLTQSVPKTWQVGGDGTKREVVCNFTLLGADRFGFAATGWDGDTRLTIDPGLIWSTYLGGSEWDGVNALSVAASGVVTVAGTTNSANFPMTTGAYDTTFNGTSCKGGFDVLVSRLDPSKTGSAQLVYSTFLGGGKWDWARALSVDVSGVVTVVGDTQSTNFPTTSGAYDTTFNGGTSPNDYDAFVSRLDPSRSGVAQLVYSTYLGGTAGDGATALAVGAKGAVSVAGWSNSTDFPTAAGAYNMTHNGNWDAFVSRLDPSKTGSAQLVYSTYLGGTREDWVTALCANARGVFTVTGRTQSPNFPTASGAYDTTYNGGSSFKVDAFVSRLDPSKSGSAQLVYSTYLGGSNHNHAAALSADVLGVVTVSGRTQSTNFPTTSGAYDTTFNGAVDAFVSRLDPNKTGAAQLVFSSFLGGNLFDNAAALFVDANGVVSVAGRTQSPNFPTTSGAYDRTYNGGVGDAFVSRLDPRMVGSAQLVYSTFLGGNLVDYADALSVDAVGVLTVVGRTGSTNFPTTRGAYDPTHNGPKTSCSNPSDACLSRLDMGVALYGDVHEIAIKSGGKQTLTVNAGKAHASRLYWIFGSITGSAPGLNLLGVHIPLNPDLYTDVAMAAVNTTVFTKFRGTLDANGLATASFVVPANLPLPSGFTFHHAYVVYDASGKFYMASNAVPVRLM